MGASRATLLLDAQPIAGGRPAGPDTPLGSSTVRRDPDAEWRALAERALNGNPFFDPRFLRPAVRALLPGEKIRLAMGRSSAGALIALAPVVERRLGGMAPVRSIWVHEYGPLGTPLLDASHTEEAAAALLDAAAGDRGLVLPEVPVESETLAAITAEASRRGRTVDVVSSHSRAVLLRRPGPHADLRAGLASRRRKEFARQMRRLGELGAVSVEAATEPLAVDRVFTEFLALEQAGWKGAGGSALASQPAISAFAAQAVRAMAIAGACRISSLRLDGRPIAVAVSFVARSLQCSWKIAHDPAFERFSPGAQLMLELGTAALRDAGIQRVDSLAAPDHPMIDHLWRDRQEMATLVVGPPSRSLLYGVGLTSARLLNRTRARLRAARNALTQRSRP